MGTIVESHLPPAMEGIVAEHVQLSNTNYLTHNRVYSKTGRTKLLATDPAVVHFGGFQLGQMYKQTLRVRNISTTGTRVHIVPPTTPYFKARCDDKKGLLAPGMAEVVEVEFYPQAFKYYYDCVRIHSEDENLLVPIHGYPVMNETKFPKRVDFGIRKVALGDRVTKRFKLECKVPIEFEYEIVVIKPSSSFTVEPLQGVVPAHGHVSISITFEPLTLSTESMEIEVRLAEFAAQPVRCTITGAASPGQAKERLLALGLNETADLQAADTLKSFNAKTNLKLTMEQLDGTELIKVVQRQIKTNKGGGTARGGAGGGDAFTMVLDEERKAARAGRDCRVDGPITTSPPNIPGPPPDTQVEGIYFPPTTLTTTADMTFVLNQQPGKLQIKDVKEAIRKKQQEQSAERAALDDIMSTGMSGGVHPLERPEVPAHIKAALFAQLLSQAEEGARKVTLGSGVHIGEDIMCAEEVAEAQRLREDQHTAHQANTELVASQRLEVVCEPAGALHLPLAPRDTMSAVGEGPRLCGAAFAATATSTDHLYRPAWRLIETNDLEKRAANMVRFQRCVWTLIYTARLKKNLARIQGVLAQLGWDKQRLAEESANPVLLISEADRPGTAPTKYLKPDNVRTRPLPLYRDVNFTYHGPVTSSHYTDFDELGPQSFREPLEYQLLGYSPEAFPGLTPYTPTLLDQPLEDGAVEERCAEGLQACGVLSVSEVQSLPSMPDAMKQAPFTTLEIGNRYTEDRVYALPEPSWGMDVQHQIQPALFPYMSSIQEEVMPSNSVRAFTGVTHMVSLWLPRTEFWAAQLMPEVVPSLMSGADPADLLQDAPDDADKPAIKFTVPSDSEISQQLPADMPDMLQDHTHPSDAQQQTVAGSQQGSSAGYDATQVQAFELLRARRKKDLDDVKRAGRIQALTNHKANISQYNDKLKLPSMFALQL